ncbi:hypothetical protein C6A86_006715 [Mycobacterium sp. ITM-2016-00316]|uniref:hypothetical protein n=1 Tax=Mycobacterium sp. ITM-2016-00316 TaxID=2099695 RepID=UPI000CF8BF49|nr:hypothetical protein [Mycobacterium sp. ITM-2016-00316]WNG83351.1 hypothetical protein C6A86_006715 [Mycobacterium sp. ITM-2016-00316]
MPATIWAGQVARNEVWNHAGNVVSLSAAVITVSLFGERAILWLMVLTIVVDRGGRRRDEQPAGRLG